MKHTLVYSTSLALLLAASATYGDRWEGRMDAEAGMAREAVMQGTPRFKWPVVHHNRQIRMERNFDQVRIFDIENLPPTAAGPRARRNGMRDWVEIEANRRKQLERSLY